MKIVDKYNILLSGINERIEKDMEWLVVVFYVLGICFGVYLGKTLCNGGDGVKVMDCRNHIQGLLDELEVRLQDDDFASDRERAMALGRNEAYYGLLEYIDEELLVGNN